MNEVRRQQAAVTRRMMATVSELSLYQVRMMMLCGAEWSRWAVALRKGWWCRLVPLHRVFRISSFEQEDFFSLLATCYCPAYKPARKLQ